MYSNCRLIIVIMILPDVIIIYNNNYITYIIGLLLHQAPPEHGWILD